MPPPPRASPGFPPVTDDTEGGGDTEGFIGPSRTRPRRAAWARLQPAGSLPVTQGGGARRPHGGITTGQQQLSADGGQGREVPVAGWRSRAPQQDGPRPDPGRTRSQTRAQGRSGGSASTACWRGDRGPQHLGVLIPGPPPFTLALTRGASGPAAPKGSVPPGAVPVVPGPSSGLTQPPGPTRQLPLGHARARVLCGEDFSSRSSRWQPREVFLCRRLPGDRSQPLGGQQPPRPPPLESRLKRVLGRRETREQPGTREPLGDRGCRVLGQGPEGDAGEAAAS